MVLMLLLLILFFIPGILALIRFCLFLVGRASVFPHWLNVLVEICSLIGFPVFLLVTSFGTELNCCDTDPIQFAPEHTLSITLWWLLATVSYFHIMYRKRIKSPVLEVAMAWILMATIVLNGVTMYQFDEMGWVCCVPIFMFLIQALTRQHQRLFPLTTKGKTGDESMLDAGLMAVTDRTTDFEYDFQDSWVGRILYSPVFLKYPALIVLGLPVFVVVDAFLLLFGQKPDSVILAFTQTYHLPLSELDHLCEGVSCGGHYLCSVAANGHQSIVKPSRMGVRHGRPIICNRQLLVANAFEELLQERFPAAHRIIRRHYDRVGDFIHKDYTPYENKYLCDLIYLLMKPADWCFRIVLYTFDRRPEDRIARQYTQSMP